MVQERALFTKLLLVKQGQCQLLLHADTNAEIQHLSAHHLLLVTPQEIAVLVRSRFYDFASSSFPIKTKPAGIILNLFFGCCLQAIYSPPFWGGGGGEALEASY